MTDMAPFATFLLAPSGSMAAVASTDEGFAEVGSVTGYKRVEQYWDKDLGSYTYQERSTPPPSEKKMTEFDQYCFLVVYWAGKYSEDVRNIRLEIKSQPLKSMCRRVIGNREGISWSSPRLHIAPIVFFHYYTRLSDYLQTLRSQSPESAGVDHLQLLLSYTRDEYADEFRELNDLTSRGEITFELLKCIFLPDTILYTSCSLTGAPQACRMVEIERVPERKGMPEHWRIRAAYVEATGDRSGPRFGHGEIGCAITSFPGVVDIQALGVYPLTHHEDEPAARRQLIARGRMWEALDGVFHKRYEGVAYTDTCPPHPMRVSSRIMIDRALYDRFAQDSTPSVRSSRSRKSRGENHNTDGFPDPYPPLSKLSDEDALLSPDLVYGFSLEDKRWFKFNIKHITEIIWRDEAFDSLVLPEAQKNLIKGLVEAQAAERAKFDDFIEGKGRGLVLNLFGPPGVGKTLSAEATSEHLRRPLYAVGASDLGTSPSELDRALTRIFKLGSAWRAVVLIDEADVYLEQRSTHDLSRNALVSVFLRQIEYFAGLLFLTTNRVRTFDEAFQSRIHVSLRYYDLDEDARRALWRSFLGKAGAELSPDEEATLAVLPLNGRQIKNAVRTATAVASNGNEQVAYGHIKDVVDIMQQFEEDFRELAVAQPAPEPVHPQMLVQKAWEMLWEAFPRRFYRF